MPSKSLIAAIPLALLAAACSGGGGTSADVRPGSTPEATVNGAPNSFLLFPNPQKQADGTLQTDSIAWSQAYYRAVDPLNERDTIAKYKAKNQFDSGTGVQYTVVFGDKRDLGYGRRMTVRRNTDGTVAFFVENYLIQAGPDYVYSPLNLEAAVVRDTKWFVGANAIEFSPGPAGGVAFPKWFTYNPDGSLRNQVDLDNRGEKATPGPCITCHGGRGDALTPADSSGLPRFNLVQNSPTRVRGDVMGRLHPFEADVFDFSTRAGFTRPEQEAAIKEINKIILCTYPLTGTSTAPEDQCRRPAISGEWEAPAATLIKQAYGGDGLPSATFRDEYVPQSWVVNGQSTLYREVIAPHCRTCHAMRGTGAQSDIDFTTYEKFRDYADRVKVHVFDRGNMPLAKIVYDAFWSSPTRPKLLANWLESRGFTIVKDAAGNPVPPGRPVADPGPGRVVAPGATRLSASNSLFTASYAWTLVSGGNGATIAEATTATPTFTATVPGTYVLQLVTGNGAQRSEPVTLTIVVSDSLPVAPSAVRFADIKSVMQTNNRCTQCHRPDGDEPRPPLWYSNEDRNGDALVNATDDAWFHAEVRSRINFTEIGASPLLRKPSGNHHGGRLVAGFDASKPPGDPARANYDLFLNWILNGAPL